MGIYSCDSGSIWNTRDHMDQVSSTDKYMNKYDEFIENKVSEHIALCELQKYIINGKLFDSVEKYEDRRGI